MKINNNNVLDLKSLDEMRRKSMQDKRALAQAAKQFEAIFLKMYVDRAKKAGEVFKSSEPFNSKTVDFYQDMYNNQLTSELANSGSLGLADLILEQFSSISPPKK